MEKYALKAQHMLEYLVTDKGMDINTLNAFGRTALDVGQSSVKLSKILLQLGAINTRQ